MASKAYFRFNSKINPGSESTFALSSSACSISYFNFGISKKSKFASRVDEFKSALLSDDDYRVIQKTKFTSADQHDWGS